MYPLCGAVTDMAGGLLTCGVTDAMGGGGGGGVQIVDMRIDR